MEMNEMKMLPKTGLSVDALDRRMEVAASHDVDWRKGRLGVYIHYAGEDVLDVAKRAYLKFFSENGVGPKAFPSLALFEADVVSMTLGLLNGGHSARGSMTTGGTESIFLAVKAARDRARIERPSIGRPTIVAPQTAHPAFDKAGHFMGLDVVRVPAGPDFKADVAAMSAAITSTTVMMVGSAPAFPHGVVDPIPELGFVALKHRVWFHVDACVGGYLAPFAKKLGSQIPEFDFSVPGVTSMSADLHKYGFAAKGASTVLYCDEEAFSYQEYRFHNWPRGSYSTQTLVGTRPGGAIAAAWAVMNFLGEAGYIETTRRILMIREAIEAGVRRLGLEIWGDPQLSIVAFGSRDVDIFAVGDAMNRRGWFVGRVVEPSGLHLMLNMTHEKVVDEYLCDLAGSLAEVRASGLKSASSVATY